jgi:hypothetical protein
MYDSGSFQISHTVREVAVLVMSCLSLFLHVEIFLPLIPVVARREICHSNTFKVFTSDTFRVRHRHESCRKYACRDTDHLLV